MSRRAALSPEQVDRWVFNRIADAYDRARLPYPRSVVDAVLDALPAGQTVVELGAGTGLMTLPLARAGVRVVAVEPAVAMADRLAAHARGTSIEVVRAPGETTGLPSGGAGAVVLADSLHWVDAVRGPREVDRLLHPSGVGIVVTPSLPDTPLHLALGEVLRRANPRAAGMSRSAGRVRAFLAAAGLSRWGAARSLAGTAPLDEVGLRDLLRSHSFLGPALGPAGVERVLDEAVAVAWRAAGPPPWAWDRAFDVTVGER